MFDTYGRIEADVFCLCGKYRGMDAIKEYVESMTQRLNSYGLDFEILPVFGIYLITDKSEEINDMYDKANLASKHCKGNYMENYCLYEEQMKDVHVEYDKIMKYYE